jgi:hypothetical protein
MPEFTDFQDFLTAAHLEDGVFHSISAAESTNEVGL